MFYVGLILPSLNPGFFVLHRLSAVVRLACCVSCVDVVLPSLFVAFVMYP